MNPNSANPNSVFKIKKNNPALKLEIAGYDVCAIPTGLFGLDGGAMFGTVPKVLWQKSNPADENNRIPMEARALLLKAKDQSTKHKNILIDTGNGSDFIAKYGEKTGSQFKEMYSVDENGPNLISSLKSHGLSPDDITDVILTHLHFDHAGGATCSSTKNVNVICPTFSKAMYYLQRANLETAKHPNRRERASYFAANFEPLLLANQLTLFEGDTKNILPNISVVVSNGHTQGHQSVIVEDESKKLIYCGDVIPTSSHVRSAWIMGYDLNALMLIEEKTKLLNLSLEKPTYYYFEHDAYCDLATVVQDKADYKISERFDLK